MARDVVFVDIMGIDTIMELHGGTTLLKSPVENSPNGLQTFVIGNFKVPGKLS